MPEQRITKVSYKGEKLTIQWESRSKRGDIDKHSIETKTEPHPDFITALRNLDKVQAAECELPENKEEYKRHDVIGVSLSYELLDDPDDHGQVEVMSAMVTSLRRMDHADSPMTVNSPMKPETSQVGMEMRVSSAEAIWKLIDEAGLFIQGKRNDLFSGEMKPTG